MMNGLRKQFIFPRMSSANWFPGHMAKGMREMGKQLQNCSCVLEVHDARIPLSCRNPHFSAMLNRPKILVLNKIDLADSSKVKDIITFLSRKGEREVILTNCQKQHHRSVKELMSRITKVVGWKESSDETAIKLMVMGMPNVGKSSLINALRRNYIKKGKATKVGKLPGVTRSVLTRIIVSDHPRMYLVDTPGVMMPGIPNEEVAMKMAIIGMLQDHLIGERIIVDYLLYILNQHQLFEYVKYYEVPEPCDNIEEVLDCIARRIGALEKGGIYDRTRAAQHFLLQFRAGKLGKITLDDCPDTKTVTKKVVP